MYIEKVLDLWIQLMKNGGKNKSVAFIILVSVYIYIYICVYMYHFPNQNPIFSWKAENEKNVSAAADYQWHFLCSITSNKLSFLYAGDEDILFHLPIKSQHYSAPPRSPRSSLCMLSPWTKTSIWSAAVLNEPNPRAPKHQLKCRWNDFPPCASVLSLHNALTPLRWRA